MKKRTLVIFAAAGLAAATALVFAALALQRGGRPSGAAGREAAEKKTADTSACVKITGDLGRMSDQEKQLVMLGWQSLPAEARTEIFTRHVSNKLDGFVDRYKAVPEDKRREFIASEVDRIRKRRAALTPGDDKTYKEFMSGMDMKQITEKLLNTYQSKCSPQERAEFDPLVHEYLRQFNDVLK